MRNTTSRSTYGREFGKSKLLAWLGSTRLDHGLNNDAEGVADRSRGSERSERSFDPRIEERANTKHPEGMPDRVIPNVPV